VHARRRTKRGRRTRYECRHCGRTFTAITGTPYERLRHSATLFDLVARMTVEGMTVTGISRAARLSASTVRRWQQRAAVHAARFSDTQVRGVVAEEVQIDELKTFVAAKRHLAWLFTAIEVSARLWVSSLLGTRSKRDTRRHLRDLRERLQTAGPRPLLLSDGFSYYEEQVRKVFGPTCIYAQVQKSYRDGQIRRSATRLVLGCPEDLEEALARSEDSKVVNTSFVERLNLTIRRMLAPLHRKTTSFARSWERLEELLALARCSYNFLRPHGSLRFGKERRTPGMQAGLVSRRLTFRDVFLSFCPQTAGSKRSIAVALASGRARLAAE
jgi:IS1 family transposase